MPRRAVPAMFLAALLAGCAAPAPKPAAVAAAPAGPPVWDGAYHGTSTRYRAASRDCPHPGILTLYVAQNQFYFPWTGGADVLAAIGPRGTVRGSGPGIVVTGRAVGKALSGDATDGLCGLHFTVRRRF